MKTRREALGEMEAPSRAFLTTLANNPSVPAKLRLDVARRLPATEQRLSGERAERAARAHRRSGPDAEAKRREIDAILAECAREQGMQVAGPKTIPAPAVLAQGRALAASVLIQYERFTRCPHNQQEVHRLDALTEQFLKWERQAHVQFPEIDTLKEFNDPRLRPVQQVPFHGDYYRTFRFYRNMLTFDEQQAIAIQHEQMKQANADSGFWGGIPGGI